MYEDSSSHTEYEWKNRFYLPTEVVTHNTCDDCWVSYLGGVHNLTELCKLWRSHDCLKPILAHAGKDISHWFDHRTNDIRRYVHPLTGVIVPYCPHGQIPDVNPPIPTTKWRPMDHCPWWLDRKYKIGYLTSNERPCRIMNVLTGLEATINVCEEDSIQRIQERFLPFNANGASYTWKFDGELMDLNQTLTENGIPDERDRFVDCGLPDNLFIPCLMCYYNDDMAET